jgi:hypothetical protein
MRRARPEGRDLGDERGEHLEPEHPLKAAEHAVASVAVLAVPDRHGPAVALDHTPDRQMTSSRT